MNLMQNLTYFNMIKTELPVIINKKNEKTDMEHKLK